MAEWCSKYNQPNKRQAIARNSFQDCFEGQNPPTVTHCIAALASRRVTQCKIMRGPSIIAEILLLVLKVARAEKSHSGQLKAVGKTQGVTDDLSTVS